MVIETSYFEYETPTAIEREPNSVEEKRDDERNTSFNTSDIIGL